jgi:Mn-dependent DtxR family transcriptional regulator
MTRTTVDEAALAALRRLYHATGEPVTTRELADELGLASNSVAHRYLTRLCHEGLARQMRRAGYVPVEADLRAEVERLRAEVAELRALSRRERLGDV